MDTIIQDQTLAGEGCPHGVTYSWGKYPFIRTINMTAQNYMTIWGQVYEACELNK